jgi:type II secretory pathway pseudopilin PulG
MNAREPRTRASRGITLTEILIAIMILGVGLVSLATLFPIGLLRLRDATRSTRTKYLVDSAQADSGSRSLLNPLTFGSGGGISLPDSINFQYSQLLNINMGTWWWDPNANVPGPWNPLSQDTAFYGDFPSSGQGGVNASVLVSGGYGLPFAYDPLWRYQTPRGAGSVPGDTSQNGYYLNDQFEARFGSGIGFIRLDPSDGGLPSAHGLQRLTNYNRPSITIGGTTTPIMPVASVIPSVFVSQEDVVWVEALASNSMSPVLPDLSLPSSQNAQSIDWHYSWMFTGYQVSTNGGSTFEGNIVIFENRPFGIDAVPNPPGPPIPTPTGTYQVSGETVVEAIFGHSGNVTASGYAAGADRSVLLRWYSSQTDPIVKPGDWIADVTYERNGFTTQTRFFQGVGAGVPNQFNHGEWDNLPAQRCYWYQVQKVIPAIDDPYTAPLNLVPPMRSMVVYVDRTLVSRTLLTGPGTPAVFNAALICPYVVNVIPLTIN